eukprot:6186339-Pleurochrysis_carterae.AAC.5
MHSKCAPAHIATLEAFASRGVPFPIDYRGPPSQIGRFESSFSADRRAVKQGTHVHSQKHSICVGERAAHAGHHALVKLVLWYHYAWRVGVDDLEVFPVYNAENAMSGSLCLGCRDCQTLANQTVHQRRLADIGYTYYGNEARAVRLRRCGRRRRRRSCASDWHRVAYDWPRQVNASAASRQKQHIQQLNPPNTREAHLAPRRRPCYRFSTVRL